MGENRNKAAEWIRVIRNYNQPDPGQSIWQIANSLAPYLLLWVAMYHSLAISYWITLALSIPAAGFLVRIFIIFHDCGHGSFFKSNSANRIVGTILGSLVFTPYDRWHKDHAIHHNTVGNLDRRGVGDVWTLTTREYAAMSPLQQRWYRIYRSPFILFGLGSFLLFVIWFRFPKKGMSSAELWNLLLSNFIIGALATLAILIMGWKAFVLIQLPVIFLAAAAGAWLFYVQHQYEEVIWTRNEGWDYSKMAMNGSSFLKLPRVLQWFTGNIGFHHVHHLGPRIPNYKLEECHRDNPLFRPVKPLTILQGLKAMNLKLWDEESAQLITFRQFRLGRS